MNENPPSFQAMQDEPSEIEPRTSVLDYTLIPFCSVLFCPIVALGSILQVNEKEEAVVLRCGQYKGTIREPGISCVNVVGREVFTVSTAAQSINLQAAKMVDGNGNPLMVSGVLVYVVTDSYKATIGTENFRAYLNSQATAVLKQVVSRYPYEDPNGGDSLKQEAANVSNALVEELNKKAAVCGVKVESFQFNELSYAPEIASAMLKRQQAEALVVARRKIVEGAVSTAQEAIVAMESLSGDQFSDDGRENLVMNMLTVLCSDDAARPTLPLVN